MLENIGIVDLLFAVLRFVCWFVKLLINHWKYQAQIWKQNLQYQETHPPISDEEFLKLCDLDVDPRIALRVRELISEVGCIDKNIIYPDARFIEDLGLD